MITIPLSRGTVPLSRFTRVDFPEPLGPTMLVTPSRGMEILSWSTAVTAPKCLEIRSVSKAGGPPASVFGVLTVCISRPVLGA